MGVAVPKQYRPSYREQVAQLEAAIRWTVNPEIRAAMEKHLKDLTGEASCGVIPGRGDWR